MDIIVITVIIHIIRNKLCHPMLLPIRVNKWYHTVCIHLIWLSIKESPDQSNNIMHKALHNIWEANFTIETVLNRNILINLTGSSPGENNNEFIELWSLSNYGTIISCMSCFYWQCSKRIIIVFLLLLISNAKIKIPMKLISRRMIFCENIISIIQ